LQKFYTKKAILHFWIFRAELAKSIEAVDIFRRAEDVPPILDQAIKLKQLYGNPFVVWMQLGIVNE